MDNEKKMFTGTLRSVSATGGTLEIKHDGDVTTFRLLDPRYWATGSSYRAYQSALRIEKLVDRKVTVHAEHHPAFGWAIFGGRNIRLAGGAKKRRRSSR